MSKNLVYIGIAALALIAIVLGYKIYRQQMVTTLPLSTNTQSQNTPQASSVNQATSGAAIDDSPERLAVLKFPGPNASEEEIKKHSDLVNKLGNESGTPELIITQCRPVPVVYRVKQGGSFKVKNIDSQDHVIYTTQRTTIKANSEVTLLSSAIGDNLGNFGYNCDNSTNPVGIIQIVP